MSSVPLADERRCFVFDDGRLRVVIRYRAADAACLEIVRLLLEHAERRACRERVEPES